MNSLDLKVCKLRALVVYFDGELARQTPNSSRPFVMIPNKSATKVSTLTSQFRMLSSSFSLTLKRPNPLRASSNPTPSGFSIPLKAFQQSFTACCHERHVLNGLINRVPHSRLDTSLSKTHFRNIARPEENQIDPLMDVKVSTFTYKEGEDVSVRVLLEMGFYQVELSVCEEDMILHWGVDDWSIPDKNWWPDATVKLERTKALETSFTFVCQDHWHVLMRFSETAASKHLVFVLRDKHGTWYNNGSFFSLVVKPLEMKDLLKQIVVPETNYSNWSLFDRFLLASRILHTAEMLGGEGMVLVFSWLRFSANKQLGWYSHCNYQPKDMANVQERLVSLMAEKVKRGKYSMVRLFARKALPTLPRGGGDSDQIRMGILNIMREHVIREGHRPVLEDRFLEQWHHRRGHPYL